MILQCQVDFAEKLISAVTLCSLRKMIPYCVICVFLSHIHVFQLICYVSCIADKRFNKFILLITNNKPLVTWILLLMNSILAITCVLPLVNSSLNPIFNVTTIVILMRGVA